MALEAIKCNFFSIYNIAFFGKKEMIGKEK